MLHGPGLESNNEYRKIKAHQEGGESEKSWQAKASDEADRLAKFGRRMRDFPPEAAYWDLKLQIKDLTTVINLVLGVFVLWPSHKKSASLPGMERGNRR